MLVCGIELREYSRIFVEFEPHPVCDPISRNLLEAARIVKYNEPPNPAPAPRANPPRPGVREERQHFGKCLLAFPCARLGPRNPKGNPNPWPIQNEFIFRNK